MLWQALGVVQWRAVCLGKDKPYLVGARLAELLALSWLLAFGSLPFAVSIVTAFHEEALTAHLVANACSAVVSTLIVLISVATAFVWPLMVHHGLRESAKERQLPRARRGLNLLAVIVVIPLLFLLVASLWTHLSEWVFPPFEKIAWIGSLFVWAFVLALPLYVLGLRGPRIWRRLTARK
jgi:amino acid transporter